MAETNQIDTAKKQVAPENAENFKLWLATRGGIAVWESQDFGSLGKTWSTPANNEDGTPTQKPTWQVAAQPKEVITDIARFEVCIDKVVKRFHVGVRAGGNGLSLKVTDGGSRRIRKEVEKAGKGAYYVFDYGSHENCVILAPDTVIPLAEFDPEKHKPKEEVQ